MMMVMKMGHRVAFSVLVVLFVIVMCTVQFASAQQELRQSCIERAQKLKGQVQQFRESLDQKRGADGVLPEKYQERAKEITNALREEALKLNEDCKDQLDQQVESGSVSEPQNGDSQASVLARWWWRRKKAQPKPAPQQPQQQPAPEPQQQQQPQQQASSDPKEQQQQIPQEQQKPASDAQQEPQQQQPQPQRKPVECVWRDQLAILADKLSSSTPPTAITQQIVNAVSSLREAAQVLANTCDPQPQQEQEKPKPQESQEIAQQAEVSSQPQPESQLPQPSQPQLQEEQKPQTLRPAEPQAEASQQQPEQHSPAIEQQPQPSQPQPQASIVESSVKSASEEQPTQSPYLEGVCAKAKLDKFIAIGKELQEELKDTSKLTQEQIKDHTEKLDKIIKILQTCEEAHAEKAATLGNTQCNADLVARLDAVIQNKAREFEKYKKQGTEYANEMASKIQSEIEQLLPQFRAEKSNCDNVVSEPAPALRTETVQVPQAPVVATLAAVAEVAPIHEFTPAPAPAPPAPQIPTPAPTQVPTPATAPVPQVQPDPVVQVPPTPAPAPAPVPQIPAQAPTQAPTYVPTVQAATTFSSYQYKINLDEI